MKKTASFLVGALFLAASVMPLAAMAQTNQATMPTLFDASGNPVNTGVTKLPAGNYYLSTGAQRPVQYFGNGTFYDPSIMQYGGSVHNPNGTAGAELGYVVNNSTVMAMVPGVPNTGAGGDAAGTWTLLIISGAVVLAGAAFLTYSLSSSRMA